MAKNFIRCEDCANWDMNPQDLNSGACRSEPPRAFPLHQPNGTVGSVTVFPISQRKEGCSKGVLETFRSHP